VHDGCFPATTRAQYEEGSAPALALQATMEKTKTRFANYGSYGLLCGADGLPHLIVDGDLNHAGEFLVRELFHLLLSSHDAVITGKEKRVDSGPEASFNTS
jgi:hypothetical protein